MAALTLAVTQHKGAGIPRFGELTKFNGYMTQSLLLTCSSLYSYYKEVEKRERESDMLKVPLFLNISNFWFFIPFFTF